MTSLYLPTRRKTRRITQKKYDELNPPSSNPYIGPSVQKEKKRTFINMRRDEQVSKGEASSFLVDFVDDCFDSFFVFHRSMKVGGRRTMSGSRTLSGNLPRFILNHFLSTSHEKRRETKNTKKSNKDKREIERECA